jgi:glucose/mannose-6-phosphate isomerase
MIISKPNRDGKFLKYFQINKIDYREVHSIKGSIISKLINLIYFLDYSTIYLAVLSKIDPSPTRSIDFIKDKLSS